MTEHKIILEKLSQRRLNDGVMRTNIDGIIRRSLAGDRKSQGWRCDAWATPKPSVKDNCFVYHVSLNFHKNKSTNPALDQQQFLRLTEMAAGACSGNGRWEVKTVDGKPAASVPKVIERLNTRLGNNFDHIFDREAQIQIIHSALTAFEDSNRENRFHTLLYGPPGCCKTDVLLAIARMLGDDAVLKLDITNTTSAGVSRLLLESEFLPQVLLAEEIEKQNENALHWLLGALDQRGEIRKTNYRIGTQSRDVKMLCFATVNNISLFKNVMSGALASRFPNKIYFPRPSIEIIGKILLREVKKIHGNTAWIKPTIEYCMQNSIDDPRDAIRICLCGRDKLLTGRYQRYLELTKAPPEEENKL